MSEKNIVWLGPGVVRVEGKMVRYGESVKKKNVPTRTWAKWKDFGWLGAPPPEVVTESVGILKSQWDDLKFQNTLLERRIEEKDKEIEDLKAQLEGQKDEK